MRNGIIITHRLSHEWKIQSSQKEPLILPKICYHFLSNKRKTKSPINLSPQIHLIDHFCKRTTRKKIWWKHVRWKRYCRKKWSSIERKRVIQKTSVKVYWRTPSSNEIWFFRTYEKPITFRTNDYTYLPLTFFDKFMRGLQ